MKKRLTTPLTKEVAFCLDSFKYSEGRLIAIILALFSIAGGGACFFFQGWLMVLGIALVCFGLVFLLSFTLFWKRLLSSISLQNLVKNPLPSNASVLYLFLDEKIRITLERKGVSSATEEHPYSYFNKIDVTEDYLFLNYGDAKKNPAFPVPYDGELLAFLLTKGIPAKDHRKKKD